MSGDVLRALDAALDARKQETADASYVAALYAQGVDKILQKVGEEATEVILAAKDAAHHESPEHRAALVKEVADLWFHTLVALHDRGLCGQDVLTELESRFGVSGHAEKASRKT